MLITFIFLFVYGWNVVDLLNLVSIFSHIVVQNALRNLVSPSKMMLLGIPKCTQTCSMTIFVASCPLMVFLQGMRIHILFNLPTTTNRYSCPFLVVSKPSTKSMEMISQGQVGIGNGWYIPLFILLGLSVQQNIHLLIYCATYSCILFQYTYLCKLETVFPTPKYPATLEV
jgi:hypothetical protein